jgi:4-hydroxybenzoate polyprenyltransferase
MTMGSCRTLNILMAMSCAGLSVDRAGQGGLDGAQWTVAAAFGIYIAGVTWFARDEAGTSQRGFMIGGLLVIITGLSLLATFPQKGAFAQGRSLVLDPAWIWPLLVLLLGFTIVRRCMLGIATMEPASIQAAVKQCILSLIVLDAAVCLSVRSPVWWAIGIVSLLVPALAVGRYFYST